MQYAKMNRQQLEKMRDELTARYEEKKALGLNLSMARGKPSADQLDISAGLLTIVDEKTDMLGKDGIDVRNYGLLSGIREAREFFADMLEVTPENILLYGNSSLALMYDTVARAFIKGIDGSTPWCKLDKIKFLCPVPGYDRHFTITEFFGVDMINIPMNDDGPDMDMIEKYVSEDDTVKGVWCVPKFSNPGGVVYSDDVVRRFANLKPAAKDFRIFWDNAYCIHYLYRDNQPQLLNIIDECEKAGNPDMVYEFASTSKVTFPGSGISCLAASEKNISETLKLMQPQIISHDKVNQLRHTKFFPTKEALAEHMMKHADIMRPKFETVLSTLQKELGDTGAASWTKPLGGYFISFNAMDGTAKKIVGMCKDAGVVMTGAGATYPYGKDPHDSNIRIAPTFPTPDELVEACDVFVICVKLASVEKLLEETA